MLQKYIFIIVFIKNIGINTENCFDMNGSQEFNCECNDGFEGERCEIALCENIVCENGSCDAGNCICNDGFIQINGICEETCALDPCEESINTWKLIWTRFDSIQTQKYLKICRLLIFMT